MLYKVIYTFGDEFRESDRTTEYIVMANSPDTAINKVLKETNILQLKFTFHNDTLYSGYIDIKGIPYNIRAEEIKVIE